MPHDSRLKFARERRVRRIAAPFAAILCAAGFAMTGPAAAQVSREVVQSVPPADVERLNSALRRLATNSRNVAALIDAGESALALGDLDAAVGFFGRAEELEPSNARAKMGMAAVFMRSQRPVEALRLFAEAERLGATSESVAVDRGLAYDLVGNNREAQASYRAAIARGAGDEAVRRLAISHAIAGEKEAFELALRPLLSRGDMAAFRAQAFGLAILGEEAEAKGVATISMPPDLASRIAPYLAYMPRLTKAQQAAAANLGIFPRAADIGRDSPQIASLAARGANSPASQASARLAPAGEPLGGASQSAQASQTAGSTNAAPAAAGGRLGEVTRAQQSSNVESAFEAFGLEPARRAEASAGAVDITAIDVPRETPPPAEPVHPQRIWVQVATGRDLNALGFDWRRFNRRAPQLLGDFEPHFAPWGQANRLLAGPLATEGEARELVNALRTAGLDSFPYTSPEGEKITPLQ